MFELKPQKSKTGVKMNVHHYDDEFNHQLKEIFLGHRTIFSIIGFTVGGILIGHSLWEILNTSLGIWGTLMAGLFFFVLSGIALQKFQK